MGTEPRINDVCLRASQNQSWDTNQPDHDLPSYLGYQKCKPWPLPLVPFSIKPQGFCQPLFICPPSMATLTRAPFLGFTILVSLTGILGGVRKPDWLESRVRAFTLNSDNNIVLLELWLNDLANIIVWLWAQRRYLEISWWWHIFKYSKK